MRTENDTSLGLALSQTPQEINHDDQPEFEVKPWEILLLRIASKISIDG